MGTLSDRQRRAQARRQRVTLHKTTLAEGERDLSPVEGAEAISLLTQLSRESWSAAGRPLPSYSRSETPYRFVPWRSR